MTTSEQNPEALNKEQLKKEAHKLIDDNVWMLTRSTDTNGSQIITQVQMSGYPDKGWKCVERFRESGFSLWAISHPAFGTFERAAESFNGAKRAAFRWAVRIAEKDSEPVGLQAPLAPSAECVDAPTYPADAPPAVPYPIAQQLDKALRALLTNALESGRLSWSDVEPVEEAHAALSQMAEWRSKNITHP